MNETTEPDVEKTAAVSAQTVSSGADTQTQNAVTELSAGVECPVCKTGNPPSEVYCMDCGFLLASEPVAIDDAAQRAPVYKLSAPDGTREFALRPGENSVGRENADILLLHNTVSRRHAVITVSEEGVFVTDLGSTNGTTVGGSRVSEGERVKLVDGSEIAFGSQVLRLAAPEEETREPDSGDTGEPVVSESEGETLPEETSQQPAARLVSADGAYSFDLLPGLNRLGRRVGENDVVIPDLYCSGRHAELEVKEDAYVLTDVGSTNGTFVNGEKIEANAPREVSCGDEITIGRIVFTIEEA